jgi:hypothetical protein
MADTDFAKMPVHTQRGMKRFGIGEAEWNVIRRGVENWEDLDLGEFHGSKQFINVDSIRALPDEIIENYLRKTGRFVGKGKPSKTFIDRTRYALSTQVGTMINHHADYGTATPGTGQKAFMYGGLDINDTSLFGGLQRRMLMQFKSAVVTSIDSYRMIYYSGNSLKGNWSGVTQTMAMGMTMWAVGEYAKSLLKGEDIQDPSDPTFALRAFLGAGAGGIYVDTILSAAERDGVTDMVGAVGTGALGPLITGGLQAGFTGVQAGKAALGDERRKYPALDAVKWSQQRLPNWFYGIGALNYYIFNGLKEYASPGYLRRREMYYRDSGGYFNDQRDYNFWRPTDSPRF